VPASVFTEEGIPDVLMVLIDWLKSSWKQNLQYSSKIPGVGTFLRFKEERVWVHTRYYPLYDGMLKKGDTIIIGSLGEPINTKVRALLKPGNSPRCATKASSSR